MFCHLILGTIKTGSVFLKFCDADVVLDPLVRAIEWGDDSLRHRLDKPERKVDTLECLHIFTQIAEIVNATHSQRVVVNNVLILWRLGRTAIPWRIMDYPLCLMICICGKADCIIRN